MDFRPTKQHKRHERYRVLTGVGSCLSMFNDTSQNVTKYTYCACDMAYCLTLPDL